jgi:glycerate kinase
VRILIAPDKFKDALDAPAVAEAIAAGVRDARPDAEIDSCPLGDGGEGTGGLLAAALHADVYRATVLDPILRPRDARWWFAPGDKHAIVEMAEASGLWLVPPDRRDPLQTTSFGVGQLLHTALEFGAERITLCVGGSATVDGGAGCLQALGCKFFDDEDVPIVEPLAGGDLLGIQRVERPAWLPRMQLTILADVDNPLLGRTGAAPTFAPQKGATPAAVERLEANLRHWASRLAEATGVVVHAMRSGGAAGGVPAGLLAMIGGTIEPGFDAVARETKLADRLRACTMCFTGEGRLDAQSGHGKVVAGVARVARELDRPVVALVGTIDAPNEPARAVLLRELGLADAIAITPAGVSHADALRNTAANLRAAAAGHLRIQPPSS